MVCTLSHPKTKRVALFNPGTSTALYGVRCLPRPICTDKVKFFVLNFVLGNIFIMGLHALPPYENSQNYMTQLLLELIVSLSLGQLEGPGSVISAIVQLIWYQLKSTFYGLKTIGDGNTALTFVQSRLLALQEAGMPVEAAVPTLDTVGHYFFEDGKDRSSRPPKQKGVQPVVTAHPKVKDASLR